jgi:uncharacterized membrane protein
MEPTQTQNPLPAQGEAPQQIDTNDVEQHKDLAAVSYVWVLSVVFYFLYKKSPFIRFHSKQGMVLFVLSLFAWPIPVLGRLLELVILALAVLGFLGAAQGQWKELPLVGALARRDKASLRKQLKEVTEASVRGAQKLQDAVKPQETAPAPPAKESASAPPPPHAGV